MKKVLVSFIIPIYNAEDFLDRCLKSVIAVKNEEIEIIIIDDGSTDKSLLIYERYVEIDSRIRVIKKNNGGVATARNDAIKAARGEWITFIDGDDEIIPTAYDFMIEQLNSSFELWIIGVVSCYSNEPVSEKKIGSSKGIWSGEEVELIRRGVFRQDIKWIKTLKNQGFNFEGPVAKFYQKKIILNNQIFFPENVIMGEDSIFNFLYLKYVKRISYNNKYGYLYWQNNGSVTHQFRKGKGSQCMESIELIRDILKEEYFLDYVQYSVRYYLYLFKLDWCNPDNPDSYFIRKKEAMKWRNTLFMQEVFRHFKFSGIRREAVPIAFFVKMRWFLLCDIFLKIKEKLHIQFK